MPLQELEYTGIGFILNIQIDDLDRLMTVWGVEFDKQSASNRSITTKIKS